jgi:hypothetical protein
MENKKMFHLSADDGPHLVLGRVRRDELVVRQLAIFTLRLKNKNKKFKKSSHWA